MHRGLTAASTLAGLSRFGVSELSSEMTLTNYEIAFKESDADSKHM